LAKPKTPREYEFLLKKQRASTWIKLRVYAPGVKLAAAPNQIVVSQNTGSGFFIRAGAAFQKIAMRGSFRPMLKKLDLFEKQVMM